MTVKKAIRSATLSYNGLWEMPVFAEMRQVSRQATTKPDGAS